MSITVTTADSLEGYGIISHLGPVRGIIVRAPSISQGILGSLKGIVGGNINSYRQVCETARLDAYI